GTNNQLPASTGSDHDGRTIGNVIVERFPNFFSGLFIESEKSGAGPGSSEYDQERTFDQRRRPARHLLDFVFSTDVFLPDDLSRFHLKAMRLTVRANDVNSLLLHDRRRRWPCASLGHKSPFSVMLF